MSLMIFSGLAIYFIYGIRKSVENKGLSSYSGVVTYGGNDSCTKASAEKSGSEAPVEGGAVEGGAGDSMAGDL